MCGFFNSITTENSFFLLYIWGVGMKLGEGNGNWDDELDGIRGDVTERLIQIWYIFEWWLFLGRGGEVHAKTSSG